MAETTVIAPSNTHEPARPPQLVFGSVLGQLWTHYLEPKLQDPPMHSRVSSRAQQGPEPVGRGCVLPLWMPGTWLLERGPWTSIEPPEEATGAV